jgi:hypothetical protein
VLFLTGYALSGPGLELAAVAADVHAHGGRQAVIHGRILESDGGGIANAALEVRSPTGTRIARAGEQGFFRLDILGSCATYRIALRAKSHGQELGTRLARRLCPGEELEVEARVIADGHFLWMPTP